MGDWSVFCRLFWTFWVNSDRETDRQSRSNLNTIVSFGTGVSDVTNLSTSTIETFKSIGTRIVFVTNLWEATTRREHTLEAVVTVTCDRTRFTTDAHDTVVSWRTYTVSTGSFGDTRETVTFNTNISWRTCARFVADLTTLTIDTLEAVRTLIGNLTVAVRATDVFTLTVDTHRAWRTVSVTSTDLQTLTVNTSVTGRAVRVFIASLNRNTGSIEASVTRRAVLSFVTVGETMSEVTTESIWTVSVISTNLTTDATDTIETSRTIPVSVTLNIGDTLAVDAVESIWAGVVWVASGPAMSVNTLQS